MSATSHASSLTRKSTGLTDAHIELIKMLAAKAVEQYLREMESPDEPGEEEEQVTRCHH